ncbi:MAG TPA: LuxR C-terminal-related transcriptional regulator [Acidimicrobiia bacterium]|nr:LuxR C-terminal-related transcriptional regulator [Acidimicrobiia bacterium]
MAPVVAVIESAASYRRGLEAALSEAGFTITAEPGDADAVLVALQIPDGCNSADALVGAGKVVVALLPDPSPAGHAHAFEHGAASATPWDADPSEIVTALSHAIAGFARLPVATVAAISAQWPGAHTPRPDVTDEEIGWLADLAAGETVGRIADETGYSERAMFRRLKEVYDRLGVTSRTEAIMVAERLGLFGKE